MKGEMNLYITGNTCEVLRWTQHGYVRHEYRLTNITARLLTHIAYDLIAEPTLRPHMFATITFSVGHLMLIIARRAHSV